MSRPKKYTLAFALMLYVFLVLLAASVVSGVVTFLLLRVKWITDVPLRRLPPWPIALVISCLFFSALVMAVGFRRPLAPFRALIDATQEIAAGNFSVRVNVRGPRELEELARNFNLMAKELADIETLRSDFVSNVSHEFKTPVNSIKGFATLLKKEGLDEKSRQEYLNIIIFESDRLTQLAGNVLLLSKLETQSGFVETGAFALDEQIRRCILLLEPSWERKNIEFQIELQSLTYTGNEEMLSQVWLNLLSNAIKFSYDGASVFVRLWEAPGGPTVQIQDFGRGMDAEVQKHLFEKFYQGDASRSTEGNGLGLSLAKRIVDLSGGTIEVKSAPGDGSSFTVLLPRSEK